MKPALLNIRVPRRFSSCRGMTLVELMVVTAILGVVVGAMYSLLFPVQESLYKQQQVTDIQDNTRYVLERIKADLRAGGLLINTADTVTYGAGAANAIVGPVVPNSNPRVFAAAPQGDAPGDAPSQIMQSFTIRSLKPREIGGTRITQKQLNVRAVQIDEEMDLSALTEAPDLPPQVFRIDPPMNSRWFPNGSQVKLVNTLNVPGSVNVRTLQVNGTGNDNDLTNPNRYDDNTISFNPPLEHSGSDTYPEVWYMTLANAGAAAEQTITYRFDPADTLPPFSVAQPCPSIRRIVDEVAPGNPTGEVIVAGDPTTKAAGKDFLVDFDYVTMNGAVSGVSKVHLVNVNIIGRTAALNPNRTSAISGSKNEQLQTSALIMNVK